MDIIEIGVSKGEKIDFMDQVHPTMKEKCQRYVEKSGGPKTLYRETGKKTPIQYLEESFKPLEKYKSQIAVVIDGSTTRGFTEPSQASLYSQHLKIQNAICFDVSEACNGFSRALETAYMLFQTQKKYENKYILLINNEQPPDSRAILPKDLSDYKAVASYYVGLTFSNVCTCTILKKSNNYSWNFQHHTNTQYASHISIPFPRVAQGYLPITEEYEVYLNDQYGQFCIPRMHQVDKKMVFVYGNIEARLDYYKQANMICHTFSRSIYETMLANYELGKLSLYYDTVGNLGSASLPFILYDQYGPTPQKGEKIAWLGNAAGGSDVLITFEPFLSSEKKEQEIIQTKGKYEVMFIFAWKTLLRKFGCKKKNQHTKNL